MNKSLIITVLITFNFSCYLLNAQDQFTIKPNSNTIFISEVDELVIEGYNGSEVVFDYDGKVDHDEITKRKGLRLINADGVQDNTGLGLSVVNDGEMIIVKNVKKASCGGDNHTYNIKIPKSMNVIYEHSNHYGDDLKIKNLTGELDISTNYNDVYLDGVSGPMAVKTVYGLIDAQFDDLSQNGSISLYSVYEYVEVSIPKSSKTNLNVSTSYGNFYSDLDIKVENTKNPNNYTGSDVIGSTNGGGVNFNIISTYENIYLRGK